MRLQVVSILCLFTNTFSVSANAIFFLENHREGFEACKTREGNNGICRPINDCPDVLATLATRTPKICRFIGKIKSLICCPVKTDLIKNNHTSPIRLVQVTAPPVSFECGKQSDSVLRLRKFDFPEYLDSSNLPRKRRQTDGVPAPDDYFSAFEQNETENDYIIRHAVGGEDAVLQAWPWMALFGRSDSSGQPVFFCDGVLINELYILTAAHCLLNPSQFFVRLGEHDYDTSEDLATPVDYKVRRTVFHPLYKLNRGHHDLALVELDRFVDIKEDIRPVCLPWDNELTKSLVDQLVTITGWGATTYGGPPSPQLQEVYVNVFEPSVCHESYSTLPDFRSVYPDGMNSLNILCAGDKEGGKDACQGDSGGPLVYSKDLGKFNFKYILGGIISKGYGCGKREFPGLYIPMHNPEYLQWIKNVAFSFERV